MSAATAVEARAGGDGGFEVVAYEPAMLEGVVRLVCEEYGGDPAVRSAELVRFYDHPYQRDHAIRLAAVSGSEVVGLETVFRWPYEREEKRLAILQSGNSIIDKSWRGRGVFGRLLRRLDDVVDRARFDALVGFPVDNSLGSFVRRKWAHLGDLAWYARTISPSTALRAFDPAALLATLDRTPAVLKRTPGHEFRLSRDPEFLDWRQQFRRPDRHGFFHHRSGGTTVAFDVRMELRKRFAVLTIGGVAAENDDPRVLTLAVAELIEVARASRCVTLLAIALAPNDPMLPLLRRRLFFRLSQRVHFIVKPLRSAEPALTDFAAWRLYRGDVDTW